MKSVLFKPIKGNVKYIMYAEGNGTVKYEIPDFEHLYETEIIDAYTDETWKKNGTDANNYRTQMSIAKERFIQEAQTNPNLREKCTAEQLEMIDQGKFPNDLTAHHDRTSGEGAKNVVMQIVDSGTHSDQPHKGASAMANPRIRKKDYEANYSDQSPLQNFKDKVEYTVIKHPVATSVAAGGVAACASNFLIRKFGVSEKTAMIVSGVIGLVTGVCTHMAISRYSANTYIGD